MPKQYACLFATVFATLPTVAVAQTPLGRGPIEEQTRLLDPGEFLWAADVAPEGPLLMLVSLPVQRAYLYRNGVPIAVSSVTIDDGDGRTPTGVFGVRRKIAGSATSHDGIPAVRFTQELTASGYALHGGRAPAGDATEGIALPDEFARRLFDLSTIGMTVVVTRSAAVPRIAPAQELLTGVPTQPVPRYELDWHPERMVEGPVSIVVSGADQAIRVVRNGVLIGSAPILVHRAITSTELYMLAGTARRGSGGPHWLHVPLEDSGAAEPVRRTVPSTIQVPIVFGDRVAEVLQPGTTVVLTPGGFADEASR